MEEVKAQGNQSNGRSNNNVRVDPVLDWSSKAIETVQDGPILIPVSGRLYVITHVSMFDAANAISKERGRGHTEYDQYQVEPNVVPGASRVAAIAGAAHESLTLLAEEDASPYEGRELEELKQEYDELLKKHLANDTDGNTRAGEEWSRKVAQTVYESRQDSGFFDVDTDLSIVGDKDDLEPGMAQRVDEWGSAHLSHLDPWVMDESSSLQPGEPPEGDSLQVAVDYNRTLVLGDLDNGDDIDTTVRFDAENYSQRRSRICDRKVR